jgi:hypothetical protein
MDNLENNYDDDEENELNYTSLWISIGVSILIIPAIAYYIIKNENYIKK